MDASTLQLHRQCLRLLKGGVKAYEDWINLQAEQAVALSLKSQKAHMTQQVATEELID